VVFLDDLSVASGRRKCLERTEPSGAADVVESNLAWSVRAFPLPESESEGEAPKDCHAMPEWAAQFLPKRAAGGAAGVTLPAAGSAKPLERSESEGEGEGFPSPPRADGPSCFDDIAFLTAKLKNGMLTVVVCCVGLVSGWTPSSRARFSRRVQFPSERIASRVAMRGLERPLRTFHRFRMTSS
jgi:hypothetical protein